MQLECAWHMLLTIKIQNLFCMSKIVTFAYMSNIKRLSCSVYCAGLCVFSCLLEAQLRQKEKKSEPHLILTYSVNEQKNKIFLYSGYRLSLLEGPWC